MQVRVEGLPLGVHHLDIEFLHGVQEALQGELHPFGDRFDRLVIAGGRLQRPLQVIHYRQQIPGKLFKSEFAGLFHVLLSPTLDILCIRLGPQGHSPGRGHVFLQLTNHLFKWHFLRGFLSLALSGPRLIALCNLVLRLGLVAACHLGLLLGLCRLLRLRFLFRPLLSLGLFLLLFGHAYTPFYGISTGITRCHGQAPWCTVLSQADMGSSGGISRAGEEGFFNWRHRVGYAPPVTQGDRAELSILAVTSTMGITRS